MSPQARNDVYLPRVFAVSDKWLDPNVIRENPFNKRVTDVRRATQVNMAAMQAVDYLQNGDGRQTGAHPVAQHVSQQMQRVSGTYNTDSGFNHPQQSSYTQSGVFQRADVVVRELTEDEIDQKAFFDTGTDAYNLRYLLRTLQNELMRAQSFNRPVSIMVVSINNFKNLGLDYGALALDSIASTAATALMTTCRAVDMVGRFMEDRFIVVLPETDIESAAVIAEKVRATFENIAIPHQWHSIRFQANIGLASFPGNGNDVESFIALADYASDTVTAGGGNAVLLAPTM